jgi:hypothetical protein
MLEEINEEQAQNSFSASPEVVRLKFSDVYPKRWFSRKETLEQRIFFISFSQAIACKDRAAASKNYEKAYVCYQALINEASPESLSVREAQWNWVLYTCSFPEEKPPLPPYENVPLDQENEEENEDWGI